MPSSDRPVIAYMNHSAQNPDCWVRIGEPVARAEETVPLLTRRLEMHLQREMDALDDAILLEASLPV